MDTTSNLVISVDRVSFICKPELVGWAKSRSGSYWYFDLESIAIGIRRTLPNNVTYVELYATSHTGFVYAKIFADERCWQQDWKLLQFPEGEMFFTRVG